MAILERFATPAGLTEISDAALNEWSDTVKAIYADYLAEHPQFYDPTEQDTPERAQAAPIAWPAFPARLRREVTSQEERWRRADNDRNEQDEYCEWSVERDSEKKVTRVTFTTEVPEYWDHLAEHDPDRLLALYRELVAPDVELDELIVDGTYKRDNDRNRTTTGRLAHLIQGSNNLEAAVDLVAKATVQRERDGVPVDGQQDLVVCGSLGNQFRHSDPQIARAVNTVAAAGDEITLRDPVGLYIDGLDAVGLQTPDGADPATFWTIERGDRAHAVRARYEVPGDRDYVVGDILDRGRPIAFGGQLADHVRVRVTALVKPADHTPQPQPCVP